ncbi:MAG: nickel/cobalt transporter (NicO) family protein [Methylobacteriaceae bacterium]|nr:nickel/cobalt transporter (NicO) family protein [Methylobacteriaceae bacterium]
MQGIRLPLVLLAAFMIAATADAALAQAMRHPFAVGASETGGASGGIMGWLLAEQSRFYLLLTSAIRDIRSSSSAAWTLAGLSFAYGVFHAAGPGHGKAVIASYMIANERALKRGLVLTGFAALLQGLVAIAIVTIAAVLFNATAKRMSDAAAVIEQVSYAAIAALGLWLVWRKGRALISALRPFRAGAFFHTHAGTNGKLVLAGADGSGTFACAARHHDHVHDEHCGHAHGPDPNTLDNANFSWPSALATVVAAGARPCSGAILVLVFSLAQGLYLAGIGATLAMAVGTGLTTGALAATAVFAKSFAEKLLGTEGGRGLIIARSAEFLAALLVLFVGVGLLIGASMMRGMA